MTTPQIVAESYIASWNAAPDARAAAMMAWAEDARYVDPLMSGRGRAAIAQMIEAAVAQFPGYCFVLSGSPDGHGSHVRFSWELAPSTGPAVARGTDVVSLDAEGRIAAVIGFLDEVAQ